MTHLKERVVGREYAEAWIERAEKAEARVAELEADNRRLRERLLLRFPDERARSVCPITGDVVDNSQTWHCPDCERAAAIVEVIEPDPGQNAPDLGRLNGYMLRGAKHHGLCGCTPCADERKSHRIDVHPFTVGDAKARSEGEPTAVLEYGGIRIHFSLTYLHNVVGVFLFDRRSTYAESHIATAAALKEIERRMWRATPLGGTDR